MGKRLFDFLASLFGLVLLSPLLVAIALAVALDSGLPVFYRQARVGRREVLFRIVKFRTMITNADRMGRLTTGGDSRITRIGRYLRRYKLDELPQLMNVVVGDMSLVGPRPEVPEFVAHYSAEDRAAIFSVRPGITDNASIAFRNEDALLAAAADPSRHYVEQILPKKIALYREYVAKHSLAGDIGILLKTVLAIW